jgi:transcriptional regulator with XRE-family HTH domain
MAKYLELSGDDRKQLNELSEGLSLTQAEIVKLAKVSQSWLSQVFSGYRTSANAEMLERVVNVLMAHLKSPQQDTPLSGERVKAALVFLDHLVESPAKANVASANSPGGIVPLDASYYIERDADLQVQQALKNLPVTMIVRGPVHCGKSSLLARLEQKAIEKGIRTAWFDPVAVPKAQHQADISANAAGALCELLQQKWRLKEPRHGTTRSVTSLQNWLSEALGPTADEPRLLIFDDIAKLGAYGVEEWLSSFVREVASWQRKGRVNVSIAVGLTYHFGPNFAQRFVHSSSIVHWWPRIELDWLTSREIAKLVSLIGWERLLLGEANPEKTEVLITKLSEGKDPLSTHFRDRFSATTTELLGRFKGKDRPDPELVQALTQEFHRLATGGSLYDPELFSGIRLSDETSVLMEASPEGEGLVQLNRMLLDDAYIKENANVRGILELLFSGQPYLTHAAAVDEVFRDTVKNWIEDPESELKESGVQSCTPYRQHREALRSAILGPDWNISEQAKDLLQAFANVSLGSGRLWYDQEVFLEASKLLIETGSFQLLKKTQSPKPHETVIEAREQANLAIYRLMAKDFSEMI